MSFSLLVAGCLALVSGGGQSRLVGVPSVLSIES
jgi:hypothetical protein